jgi:L,D-transpeptidase catalytic domain
MIKFNKFLLLYFYTSGYALWPINLINFFKFLNHKPDHTVTNITKIIYQCALKYKITDQPIVTIIDYSQPINKKRLWVIDMKAHRVLFNEWVSHGQTTGNVLAHYFSNTLDSHASSIGVFLTTLSYIGKHGYSLRLEGLEKNFNDNAIIRNVVLHGASYMNPKKNQFGHSWGCFVLRDKIVNTVINRIQGGSLLIVYYPDDNWIKKSKFLNC